MKGNTEKYINGYVVFKWNIHGSSGKYYGGEGVGGSARPHPFNTAEPEYVNV